MDMRLARCITVTVACLCVPLFGEETGLPNANGSGIQDSTIYHHHGRPPPRNGPRPPLHPGYPGPMHSGDRSPHGGNYPGPSSAGGYPSPGSGDGRASDWGVPPDGGQYFDGPGGRPNQGPPHHSSDNPYGWADPSTGHYDNYDARYNDGDHYSRETGNSDSGVLNGQPGSVCTRQVEEMVRYKQTVHFPCWQGRQVPCYDCGLQCRIYNNVCFKQTLSSCYREDISFMPIRVDKTFCCPGFEQGGSSCIPILLRSPCNEHNGYCQQICTDVPGPLRRRCDCFSGYRNLNATHCIDVDECNSRDNPCNQGCVNSPGSFHCTCDRGFKLIDKFRCVDINECEIGNGGCAHRCFNQMGSYYCKCDVGFRQYQGFSCHAIDMCKLYKPCSHTCATYNRDYKCLCPNDMELQEPDRRMCIGKSDGTTNEKNYPSDSNSKNKQKGSDGSAEKTTSDSNNVSVPIIVGVVVGIFFLIFCLAGIMFLARKLSRIPATQDQDHHSRRSTLPAVPNTERPTPDSGGSLYNRTPVGVLNGYRPPSQYNNLGYDMHPVARPPGVLPRSLKKPLDLPPPVTAENLYLEVLPPPYSMKQEEADTPEELYEMLDSGLPSPAMGQGAVGADKHNGDNEVKDTAEDSRDDDRDDVEDGFKDDDRDNVEDGKDNDRDNREDGKDDGKGDAEGGKDNGKANGNEDNDEDEDKTRETIQEGVQQVSKAQPSRQDATDTLPPIPCSPRP